MPFLDDPTECGRIVKEFFSTFSVKLSTRVRNAKEFPPSRNLACQLPIGSTNDSSKFPEPRRLFHGFPRLDFKALNDNDAIENPYEAGLDWRYFRDRPCRRIFPWLDYPCPGPFRIHSARGKRQATDARSYLSLLE